MYFASCNNDLSKKKMNRYSVFYNIVISSRIGHYVEKPHFELYELPLVSLYLSMLLMRWHDFAGMVYIDEK